MAVRLFIGNLPYGATEADLRAHFAPVAEPSHIVMPVDRETGRPRGFAFVEFADRTLADEVVRKFDAQPFQGRNLAVSEARAREDRPPSRPPGAGGFSGPRPGGFGGPRPPAAASVVEAAALLPARPVVDFLLALAAGIARRTSARLRPLRGCATPRRVSSRNTSRVAPSRSAAVGASTPWTTLRTIRQSRSMTSRSAPLPKGSMMSRPCTTTRTTIRSK